MTDTPRLLTMKPYEWEAVERTIDEHSALEPSYVDALHSEVLAQAARVLALEQERERIRQALEPQNVTRLWSQAVVQAAKEQRSEPHVFAELIASLPPACEREET